MGTKATSPSRPYARAQPMSVASAHVSCRAYVTNSARVKPSAVRQEASYEEGEVDSPKDSKHRSPKMFLSLTKKRLQKLFRRSSTQKVRETSHPPKRMYLAPYRLELGVLDGEVADMLITLEGLTLFGCEYTPRLLDRLSAKTPHDTLEKKAFRGGYQELAVTSIVPGERLTHQFLRSLSAEDHITLRQHLKETIMYAT